MATYLFASQLLGLRESRACQHGAIRMENALFPQVTMTAGVGSPLPFRASFELAPRAPVIPYTLRETLIPVEMTKPGGLPRTIRELPLRILVVGSCS